ncbi:unnamed protein product [Ostreobium quekettii]|uniref:Folate receptor-like domain-containing protein n=1 Tax=Ostreobium quekettii TaxID=121088 RepID=A0A8S1IW67_9CHLO|nr:unnamed protein product [Ostreobium quekettii]
MAASASVALLLALVSSCAAPALGFCEVCHLRNDHTKDFATPFEQPAEDFVHCRQWRDNACCTKDTVDNLFTLYGDEDRFDRCDEDPDIPRDMSQSCRDFFIAEDCFYECDASAGKYRKHAKCGSVDGGNSWELERMPIKASFCNDWYEACKDDYVCATPQDPSMLGVSDRVCEYSQDGDGNEIGTCRKFSDVYADGKDVCNLMWGSSFYYEPNEDQAYTMDFEGENPNNAINLHVAFPDPCPSHDVATVEEGCDELPIHPKITPHDCEVCKLRNVDIEGVEFTLNISLSVADLGPCQKYEENACCSAETASRIDSDLYGPDFAWDRCYLDGDRGEFPEKCGRWFVEEGCLYECDVSAGKYRLWNDCSDSEEGPWRISKMPLKASECDQWYEDCKDVFFCTCLTEEDCRFGGKPRSFFSLPNLTCAGDECKPFGQIYKNGQEVCEVMWDDSFVYERHEKAAYSLVWDPEETDGKNPNNIVNTHVDFPDNCDGHEAEKEWCETGSQDGTVSTPSANADLDIDR